MFSKIVSKFKNKPSLFYSMSIAATWAGVGSLMMGVEMTQKYGVVPFLLWALGNTLACIVFGIFAPMIPKLRDVFRSRPMKVIVGPDGTIRKGSGEIRYSPLADWSHEMILAFIHYNKIKLPPIYEWQNGFKCGTHPWPSRMYTESIENGWREVYAIDPSIVESAAEKISSARLFIESEVSE